MSEQSNQPQIDLRQMIPDHPNLDRLRRVLEHIEAMVVHHAADNTNAPNKYTHTSAVNGWNQGTWRRLTQDDDNRCGTQMCLAGWTIELEGPDPAVRWALDKNGNSNLPGVHRHDLESDQVVISQRVLDRMAEVDDRDLSVSRMNSVEDGTEYLLIEAYDLAQYLLGLSNRQADALFNGGNDLGDLWGTYHRIEVERRIEEARETTDTD